MLLNELKTKIDLEQSAAYILSADFTIIHINPAAALFTPNAVPGSLFLRVLCGRGNLCKDCPLCNISEGKISVPKDALCSFANVTFEYVDITDGYVIVSRWNENIDIPASIPEINLDKAIENVGGSRETYDSILEVYYNEGVKKPDIIKAHYDNLDYHNLRIEVHGLKSTSYVIGADHLGDFAKKLEFACRDIEANENEEAVQTAKTTIDNELGQLLEEYTSLVGKLSPIYKDTEGQSEDNGIPTIPEDEEIVSHLNKAIDLLDGFELEEAQNHLEIAKEQLTDDSACKYIDSILKLLNDFNYDEAGEKLKAWINA